MYLFLARVLIGMSSRWRHDFEMVGVLAG